jgi:trimeric autotransporter adhesin
MACFNDKSGVRIIDSSGSSIIVSGRCLILSSTCAYTANEINFGFDRVYCTRKIAGTGACKIAIGYGAGYANSGAAQIAIGRFALENNTGSCNVSIGDYSMRGSGAGSNNTAVGNSALSCLTSGSRNVAIGRGAGNNLTTGSDNIALGDSAGRCITTTGCSVAIGANSYANNTSGTRATAIGARSRATTYGSVAVGYCARAYGQDSIAIGALSYMNGNGVFWGNSLNNYNCVYSSWSYLSDGRDKTDVIDLDENLGINFIRKLRPVKFKNDFRANYVIKCGFEMGEKDGTLKSKETHYGFIAQEIKLAVDELGVNFEGVNYDILDDKYALKYFELLSPMVKSIKQIDNRVEILKNKLQIT